MKFNIPKLNKWVVYNDVLLGEAINHPQFEQRQRVQTNKVLKMDIKSGMAECVPDVGSIEKEYWQLGEPGNLSNYVDPITKRFF
jgi:hypothetical protein